MNMNPYKPTRQDTATTIQRSRIVALLLVLDRLSTSDARTVNPGNVPTDLHQVAIFDGMFWQFQHLNFFSHTSKFWRTKNRVFESAASHPHVIHCVAPWWKSVDWFVQMRVGYSLLRLTADGSTTSIANCREGKSLLAVTSACQQCFPFRVLRVFRGCPINNASHSQWQSTTKYAKHTKVKQGIYYRESAEFDSKTWQPKLRAKRSPRHTNLEGNKFTEITGGTQHR